MEKHHTTGSMKEEIQGLSCHSKGKKDPPRITTSGSRIEIICVTEDGGGHPGERMQLRQKGK